MDLDDDELTVDVRVVVDERVDVGQPVDERDGCGLDEDVADTVVDADGRVLLVEEVVLAAAVAVGRRVATDVFVVSKERDARVLAELVRVVDTEAVDVAVSEGLFVFLPPPPSRDADAGAVPRGEIEPLVVRVPVFVAVAVSDGSLMGRTWRSRARRRGGALSL